MRMQFGLSIVGIVFLAMLFMPNIKWAKNQPLGPIPVPIATLPVAALALLGIWYQSPIAVIAAIILGIGHIGIHLGHLRELSVH